MSANGTTPPNDDGSTIPSGVTPDGVSQPAAGTPDVDAIVAERVKETKGALDRAYKQRDEALAKAAAFEAKERERELARLQEEGKHREAFEMQLAEVKAQKEDAERKLVQLTRDNEVRRALTSFDFKNERAAEIAFKEIIAGLTQDANGNWVGSGGVAVKASVESFVKDESNSFLLKPKANSGGGSTPADHTTPSTSKETSVFNMSQEEVIRRAREGTLRK
jgi:hypothetical protein